MIQGITMTIYNGIKLSRNVQLNITTFKQIEKNTQQNLLVKQQQQQRKT